MWELGRAFGWADIVFWAVLVIVVLLILVAMWWPTRHRNGE